MEYWENGLVLNLLLLAGVLWLGTAIRSLPFLRTLGIPGSILGGVLGLLLGKGVLGLVPLDTDLLELIVYHGLAFVFIAVSLQTPRKVSGGGGGRSGGALSIAIAIAFFLCLQAAIGMVISMVMGIHPGFGLLMALGFEQGPGQALAMGNAWESTGLQDGAQVGLIIAAIGFAWSIFIGVPLAAWGRRRQLNADLSRFDLPPSPSDNADDTAQQEPGSLEALSRQLIAIGIAYLLTYGLVSTAAGYFVDAGMDNLAHTAWGFHFIFGALFGMVIRVGIARAPVDSPLDDRLLGRLAGLAVDVVTCAALAAVQVEVLTANLIPILVITSVGGIVTLVFTVWLSARSFPTASFEHCVMLFGMVTGTLPMGLALLRTLDPEMRTPASINAVVGSAMSIPLVAVFLLGLLPLAINPWPTGYPGGGFIATGAFVVYGVGLIVLWRVVGPLRFVQPLSMWPDQNTDEEGTRQSA
ncbi:MAG: hypothetical protein AAFV53_16115 [Myxococcota bacterium]